MGSFLSDPCTFSLCSECAFCGGAQGDDCTELTCKDVLSGIDAIGASDCCASDCGAGDGAGDGDRANLLQYDLLMVF